MIHSYPGCRQGRNNVRLTEDLRIVLAQSNHVLEEVVLRLRYLWGSDSQQVIKGIIEYCEFQVKMNESVEDEAHNTLD